MISKLNVSSKMTLPYGKLLLFHMIKLALVKNAKGKTWKTRPFILSFSEKQLHEKYYRRRDIMNILYDEYNNNSRVT